jgi:hypothetical protein
VNVTGIAARWFNGIHDRIEETTYAYLTNGTSGRAEAIAPHQKKLAS